MRSRKRTIESAHKSVRCGVDRRENAGVERSRINAIRTLLVNFTRVSLAGEVPAPLAGREDFRTVATALTRDPVFFAEAVTAWSEPERRALFEMLAAAITELRMSVSSVLEGVLIEGSSPAAVGASFARWIASRSPVMRHGPRRRPGSRSEAASWEHYVRAA